MWDTIISRLDEVYGIIPIRIVHKNNICMINSIKGKYVMKAYNNHSVINRVKSLITDLRKTGYDGCQSFIYTKKNSFGIKFEGRYFVLMRYIEGRHAKYNVSEDMEKVLEALAKFHHHASRLNSKNSNATLIYNRLAYRLLTFDKLYQQIKFNSSNAALDKIVLQLGELMIENGKKALQSLAIEDIRQLYQEAIDNNFIAHRDVASHNFLINKKAIIIDFDLAKSEPQFLDLWQLLNRSMIDWEWSIDAFKNFEGIYYNNRKLREKERKILYQLSKFPNDFFRESIGAYYYPEKFKSDNVLDFMTKYNNSIDKYIEFNKLITTTI